MTQALKFAAIGVAGGVANSYWVNAFSDAGWTDTGQFSGSAVDSSGNIYCAGRYRESAGSQPFYAFLVKYAPDGSVTWQRRLYESGKSTDFSDVAVDTSGNVLVCGSYSDSTTGLNIALVAKYNSAGTLQWQRTLNDGGNLTFARAITTDSSGNVYVAGDTLNDGSGTVVKYNSSGTLQWQRYLFQGANNIQLIGIALDGAGNVYVAGFNNSQGLLAKLAGSNGFLSFFVSLAMTFGEALFFGLTVDSTGRPIVCGYYTNDSPNNWLVAQYNSSGVLQWQRALLNDGGEAIFLGVAVDASNNVYAAGAGVISGTYAGVLAKYNSSGTLQWQRGFAQGGGNEFPYFLGISHNGSGAIYPVGTTEIEVCPSAVALPDDGTKTGTHGDFIYASISLTGATATGVEGSPSGSEGDYTYTSSTSTLTDAATTFTATKTTIT